MVCDFMKYRCRICGYIYDDAKEKVPFDQLPDTWKCPLCGAKKSDFEPLSENDKKEAPKTEVFDEDFDDMEGLTVGQLSALCSNLARGCEKQYKKDEMVKFMQLADYFASVGRPAEDGDIKDIAAKLMSDLDEKYPKARSVSQSAEDRGAQRICVWGEKVTRMLNSLVQRYIEEGESMLKDTQIWVCTVCGFVYVGDKPPEKCPVCSVPSWKFEKMEAKV